LNDVIPHDIWFKVFVAWYVFSAVVTGMPEPKKGSRTAYVWLFRSSHILAASGTAYFNHRMHWPEEPEPEADVPMPIPERRQLPAGR
jgi:hypothetical protein